MPPLANFDIMVIFMIIVFFLNVLTIKLSIEIQLHEGSNAKKH